MILQLKEKDIAGYICNYIYVYIYVIVLAATLTNSEKTINACLSTDPY